MAVACEPPTVSGCGLASWLVLPGSTILLDQAAYCYMIVLTAESQMAAMAVRRQCPFRPPATPPPTLPGQDTPCPGQGPNRPNHNNTPVLGVKGL